MTSSRPIWISWLAWGIAAPVLAQQTLEPTPLVRLGKSPRSVAPRGDADGPPPEPKESPGLAQKRIALIRERDTATIPGENLPATPRQFCVGGQCFANFKQVAAALYPESSSSDRLSVYCAPRRLPGPSQFDAKDPLRAWEIDKVHCHRDWGETLGYRPWAKDGEPNEAPEPGTIPPYACFGNPHQIIKHVVLAPGGVAGSSGFVCRRRMFRVLVTKAIQNIADQKKAIAQMCTEMRQQVWAEKYPDINSEYQKWCQAKGKDYCLPKGSAASGIPGAKPLPFMLLMREELLHFFGHREFFCRADRPGLTHFLFNEPWADTFTCGVARGMLEGGPFEEGVQLCGIAPYVGDLAPRSPVRDPFKARMHCWKFNRPTCEEISGDQTKDDVHKSNVFDAFDALREFRRTRRRTVLGLFDLKDAEKLVDYSESIGFSDTGKDEGIFGVKEFCRFVGDTKTIQCGYSKDTVAHWYQLRKLEEPAGCRGGVCARGAYKRGYLCGLFASPEMFDGKPYWMCGLDVGKAGRDRLRRARAICLGGSAAGKFQSSKGDRTTLQCYERKFKWAESAESKATLRKLDWTGMLKTASDAVRQDPKLASVLKAEDVDALTDWAKVYGHTFGHRTSIRIGFMRSKVPAVLALSRLKIERITDTHDLNAKEQKDKIKSLNELIAEVLSGERAPDSKWWHEFFSEAFEGKRLRIDQGLVDVAHRMVAIFRVLDVARDQLLALARTYASQVLARAKKEGPLSRLEVHERMRAEIMDDAHKGNIYCVRENAVREAMQSRESKTLPPSHYVCGSSALAAAGLVELIVEKRKAEFRPEDGSPGEDHPRQYEQFKQKLRTQMKSEWCYGATRGGSLYGPAASPALFGFDLSSPFLLEATRGVIDLDSAATNRNDQRKWLSAANWLKCSGFQYSDEHWQHSVPGGGRRAARSFVPGADRENPAFAELKRLGIGVGVGDGKASALGGMVGGLVGALINMVLPGLGDAPKLVRDMGHASSTFLQSWGGKYIDKAKKIWEKGQKLLEKLKKGIDDAEKLFRDKQKEFVDAKEKAGEMRLEALEKADQLIKDAMDDVSKAEVQYAAAIGPAKEKMAEKLKDAKDKLSEMKAKAKGLISGARGKADELVKEAKTVAEGAGKDFDQLRKGFTKEERGLKKANKIIHGSGEMVGEMLEDLLNRILARIMNTVKPKARDLMGRGFRFVRSILGPIAKSIIGALASIPFVGGALAVLGQIAYDAALNALEDFAFEKLSEVVERLLAKTVRALMTPLIKEVQAQVTKMVHSACQAFGVCSEDGDLKFSALPEKDRWIARAMGCQRKPFIDRGVQERAVAARSQMLRMGREMKQRAPQIALALANRYLRRFGVSVNDLHAAAKGKPGYHAAVRVEELRGFLDRLATTARQHFAKR